MQSRFVSPLLISITLFVAGCGGSNTTTTADPAPTVELVSITVTPANSSITAGTAQEFVANGTYSDGTTNNISGSVFWSSAPTAVATITSAGVATAVVPGTSVISATFGAITNSATLTVTARSMHTLELLAGNIDGKGNLDGTGAAARFNFPYGIATDTAGNKYVTDADSHTIRKITPAGVVTTLAGSAGVAGSADGTGAAARFNYPYGITIDAAGNLYVADRSNHTIRKITPAGVVSTLAGLVGVPGVIDGTGTAAAFYCPHGITIDTTGNLYVTENLGHTIRKITPAGVVTTLAGSAGVIGSADGTGAAARFNFPTGIVADAAGNLYVADTNNFTIRKVTPAGVVTTFAGTVGTPDCNEGAGAGFESPEGITVDTAGNVYVVDTYAQSIRKVTPAGIVTTFAGRGCNVWGSVDGTGMAARFRNPHGITIDAAGDMYVVDTLNYSIRKVTAAGVVTYLAGSPELMGSDDGIGAAARFDTPYAIAAAVTGDLYVADHLNHTIRKITAAGVVTTFAGSAKSPGSADGLGAAAQFNYPGGVAADGAGNVYVADTYNHTIRKLTPAGLVTTLAGSAGLSGRQDGAGAAARFYFPHAVATDTAGNVYVADTYNHAIRKITAAGLVTTLAGAGVPGSADGTGASARFSYPRGITTDTSGNVYVSDYWNHCIRKITPAGDVTTLAGSVISGNLDGASMSARFYFPHGITADTTGSLYVADSFNHTVRKISAVGVVSTVLGSPTLMGFEAGRATPGLLSTPRGVAVYGNSLFILDTNGIAVTSPLP